MNYRLFRLCDGARIDTVEGHVLVRAYGAVWRALYLCEPVGQHVIENLGLAIDFGARGSRRQ
jgi:hypothetical protein